MTIRRSVLLSLVLVVFGTATSVTAMPIVSVLNPPTVSVGDSFDVDIMIDDVLAGGLPSDGLHSFQFELAFDPAVIDLTGSMNGDFLDPSIPFRQELNDSNAMIGVTRLFPMGIIGSGKLFSLSFIAVDPGTSPLVLSNVLLSNPFGVPLTPFELQHSRVTVAGSSQVPEPAAGALLVLGLVALAGRSRRRAHS